MLPFFSGFLLFFALPFFYNVQLPGCLHICPFTSLSLLSFTCFISLLLLPLPSLILLTLTELTSYFLLLNPSSFLLLNTSSFLLFFFYLFPFFYLVLFRSPSLFFLSHVQQTFCYPVLFSSPSHFPSSTSSWLSLKNPNTVPSNVTRQFRFIKVLKSIYISTLTADTPLFIFMKRHDSLID